MRNYVLLVLTSTSVFGWWDGGHYISGWIAHETLLSQGRRDVVEKVEQILSLDPDNYPDHTTFLTAPTWMDDIRSSWSGSAADGTFAVRDNFQTWNPNHFMNIPLANGCSVHVPGSCPTKANVDAYLANSTLNHINVPLRGAFNHLAPYNGAVKHPQNARLWSLELDLKYIFHLVGDAHMPYHTSSIWHRGLWECPEQCIWHFCDQCEEKSVEEGGEPGKKYIYVNQNCVGGNAINVRYAADVNPEMIPETSNMHGFWDSMGGFATVRASDAPDELKVRLANEVMDEWPLARVKDEHFNTWDDNWTLEDDVYPEAYAVASQGTEWEGTREDGERWYGFLGVDTNMHVCFDALRCSGAACRVNCEHFTSETECNNENFNYCSRHRAFVIDEAYRQFSERASKRLVALAGYRLADALRRVVDGLGPRLIADVNNRQIGECSPDVAAQST